MLDFLPPALRGAIFTTYFVLFSVGTYVTTVVGLPLRYINPPIFAAWVDLCRRHFGLSLVALSQVAFSRTKATVYAETEKLRSKLSVKDNRLEADLDLRAVVISNHQLYNDWQYLWWLSYTAKAHGALRILLKKSIKKVPILGWGMQHFGFVFLSRSWKDDEKEISKQMTSIKQDKDYPAWLLVFPEGTTVSANGVAKSQAYAEKTGIANPPKHLLLPRVRGLQACLLGLDKSIETLYDFTIYYDGIPQGQFGEDYYSIEKMLFKDQYPAEIKVHIREYAIADIPYENDLEFEQWLLARWVEKDEIMEQLSTDKPPASFGEPLHCQPKLEAASEAYGPFNVPLIVFMIQRLVRKYVS